MRNGTLQIGDVSDLGILHAVCDEADNNGYVEAGQIAELLDVGLRSVTSRFAWLRSWGVLERRQGRGWRLSRKGVAILEGANLDPKERAMITGANEGRVVGYAEAIGSRRLSFTGAKLASREFAHHRMNRM